MTLHLLESGIFEYVDGCIVSPITSASLRLLNCTVDDLFSYANSNTPELNPPKMLVLEDAVFLTTMDGLYGATAILYDGALKEISSVLQTPHFHILPISEHGVLCTNSLTLERKKNLMMNESAPLTKSVYEYSAGIVSMIP